MKYWWMSLILVGLCLSGCTAKRKVEIIEPTFMEEIQTECPVYLSIATAGNFSDAPYGKVFQSCLDDLNASGLFDVSLYENGIMGEDAQLIRAVQNGTISVTMMSPSGQTTVVPGASLLDIPWLFPDSETYQNFLNESGMRFLEPLYAEKGLVLLGISAHDYRYLTSNRPIYSVEDLQGLKIRIQDNICHRILWESLGAEPVPIDFHELYMALYNGTVDAQENPYVVAKSKRLYEVQDYIVETGHLPTVYVYVMNQEQWNQMTAEHQEMLKEEIQRYISEVTEQMPKIVGELRQWLTETKGMTLLTPDEAFQKELLAGRQAVVDYIKTQIGETEVELYLSLVDSYKTLHPSGEE